MCSGTVLKAGTNTDIQNEVAVNVYEEMWYMRNCAVMRSENITTKYTLHGRILQCVLLFCMFYKILM